MRLSAILLIGTLVMHAAAHAGAPTQAIEHDIEQANAYIDTNPDSALLAVRAIEQRHGKHLSESDKVSLAIISGNAHFSAGDVTRGISCLRTAVAGARRADDTAQLIQALGDLGVMSRVAQKTDSALMCYTEALRLMKLHGAPAEDEAQLLTSIAILYTNTGRIADAVPFARRAVEKAEQSGSLETMMYAGSQGGNILFKAGHKDEGLAIERRIVRMAESRGAPRYVLKAYASIIDMHYADGRTDSVLTYIDRGNRLIDKVPQGSVESLGFMEESYVVLAALGRYAESLDIQRRILGMENAGTYMPMDKLWMRIARNHRELGQYAQMGQAYERAIAIADSLRNTEIDSQLSEFQVKYNALQKDLDNSRLEAEKARTTAWAIATTGVLLLALSVLTAYIIIRRRREGITRIRERLKGIEDERGRIARDLHDGICNDLYGIAMMMSAQNADKAEITDSLKRVRAEVRSISHELMPPQFTNSTLDELLEAYAAHSDGFLTYTARNADCADIANDTAYQIYRIVQELVQNIHKHTRANGAQLTADFRGSNLTLSLLYTDSSTDSTDRGDGIGAATIKSRTDCIHATLSHTVDGNNHKFTLEI